MHLPSGKHTKSDIENGPVEIVKIYPATKNGGSFHSFVLTFTRGYQSFGDPHLLALEFLVAPEDLHQLYGEFAFPPLATATDWTFLGTNGGF